jgi:hypothetical protein
MTSIQVTPIQARATAHPAQGRCAKRRAALAAAGLLAALGMGAASAQPLSGHGSAQALAGAYLLTATPNPASGVPPFVNVAVVTSDGRIINFDPTAGANGLGMGSVQRRDGQRFDITFTGFTGDAPPFARFTINSTVQATKDGFAGPFRTTITAPDGQVLFVVEGQVSGVRQTVQGF